MPSPTAHPSGRPVGVRALIPYLRDHRPALAAAALLSLPTAGGTLAQPLVARQVLERITAGQPAAAAVVLLVGLAAGVVVLNSTRAYLLQRTAEGLVLATRRRLASHLLRLPIAEYDRRRTGDLLSRVGTDTTLVRAVVTAGLLELATAAVIIAGAAVMMIVLDPLMSAVTMAGLVGLSAGLLVARRIRGLSEQAQARIGEMTSAMERAISATRTIRASRAEDRESAVVAAAAHGAYEAGVRMARVMALIGPVTTTGIQGAFLLVLGVGGARVAAGAMSVGDLVAFVLFLFLLMLPVSQAMNAYTQLQAGLGALQRIEDVLSLPAETAGEVAMPVAVSPSPAPAIELDEVSFAYPGGEPVLHRVSFTIPYGTRTALVGPSGAGKSTVLALVERFYDAAGGAVRVAGVDVRDQPRACLRTQLGYVEQDAPALAGSIRDNLLLATPDATEAQLLAVLAAVNLTELVERTSEGLDAPVGEGGVLLSGGERQRLAIARTLLAAPPIMLLDEPTSNLDSNNEQALRQAIAAAAARCTLLVVAHRLATVRDCDQIVVLDHGRVVAAGTHEQLAASSTLYRELAAHQLLVEGVIQ